MDRIRKLNIGIYKEKLDKSPINKTFRLHQNYNAMKPSKFIVLLLIFIAGNSLKAQEATLQETLDWIKGKLESFKRSEKKDLGSGKWEFTNYYTYKVISTDGCSLLIEEARRKVTAQSTSRNDYTATTQYKINIGDIKSCTWIDEPTKKGFVLKTYNDNKKIQINPKSSYPTLTNEFFIQADNLGEIHGQPDRFTKAFQHVMSLCEAKQEKF
jgi:hypothetical protein